MLHMDRENLLEFATIYSPLFNSKIPFYQYLTQIFKSPS